MSLEDFAVETGDIRYALPLAFLTYLSSSEPAVWCDFYAVPEGIEAKPKKGEKPPITQRDVELAVGTIEEYAFLTLKELRVLVKRLTKGLEGKIGRAGVHGFVKSPYLPPFRLVKEKELVEWAGVVCDLEPQWRASAFADDVSALLASEIRLIFKDAYTRRDGGDLDFYTAVIDKLSDGSNEIDLPLGISKPVLLCIRDAVWRQVFFALSHNEGKKVSMSLDAFVVLTEKALGLKDWCDAVEGKAKAGGGALDYLACLAPLSEQKFSKIAGNWEAVTRGGYSKVRRRLFERIAFTASGYPPKA